MLRIRDWLSPAPLNASSLPLQAKDRLKAWQKTAIGARLLAEIKPEDLEVMDPDKLLKVQADQLEKERKDQLAKV